jgi:hypothetical protein
MRRSIPVVLLAVVLLTMGVVVGRFGPSGERAEDAGEAPPLLRVEAERAGEAPAPVLVGREAPPEGHRETARLREALDGMRAERDRLAAEVERLREEAKRWEGMVELEHLQRAANETAAIATSRNVISALAQIQSTSKIDEDGDGVGEFAGFLEMSGGAVGRMGNGNPLVPPVMSGAFRTLTMRGEVHRNGYLYRLFLPDARGNGVGEGAEGFLPSQVDPDLAETTWCLYAWPAVGGGVGQKTYFTNQMGDVLATEDPRYAGPGNGPAPDAAFRGPGITSPAAVGGVGNDGNTWMQAH